MPCQEYDIEPIVTSSNAVPELCDTHCLGFESLNEDTVKEGLQRADVSESRSL